VKNLQDNKIAKIRKNSSDCSVNFNVWMYIMEFGRFQKHELRYELWKAAMNTSGDG
jgi:hypothetical protein